MTEEEYYARIKAEYEASTDEKLVEWARPYFEGTKEPNNKDQYPICIVSERAARDIFELTGIDVHGYNQVLRCDIIRHVDKRHGKKGRADKTIQDISDIGRLKYVIDNYDYMITDNKPVFGFNDKNGNAANAIKYVKRINGYVITAETAMDVPKSKTLYILSMYKAKTPDFLTQKRESTDHCNTTAIPHARSEVDSVTSILPQPEKNVNSLKEKSFSSPDCRTEQTRTVGDERAKRAAEIAAIKAELRGKSPKEIAEMSRQARQKNKQNGNNPSGNGGKPSNGNGSGGSSGR